MTNKWWLDDNDSWLTWLSAHNKCKESKCNDG